MTILAYAIIILLGLTNIAGAQKFSDFITGLPLETHQTTDRIPVVRGSGHVFATTIDAIGRLGTPGTAIGLMSIVNPSTSLADLTDLYLFRDANYIGGTWANTNTVISASTTNRAGNKGLEWNAWFGLDNYGTLADAAENTALYANSIKRSTGSTWGAIAQVTDYSTGVATGQSIGLEIDLQVNNADTSSNRTMLELYVNKTAGSVDPPSVSYGMRFDGVGALYTYGIAFDGSGSNYWYNLLGFVNSPRYLHGIDLTGAGLCDSDNFKSLNFIVDCSGNVGISASSQLNMSASGTSQGYLRIVSSGTANYLQSGLNSTSASAAPLIIGTIAATAQYAIIAPTGTVIGTPTGGLKGAGTLNVQNAYYAGGTAGVSCGVGTLNPATAVVTNGIVTAC